MKEASILLLIWKKGEKKLAPVALGRENGRNRLRCGGEKQM